MELPTTISRLIDLIDGGESSIDRELYYSIPAQSHHELDKLLKLSTTTILEWNSEIALIALWRAFLNLIPASVIEQPEVPCRSLVMDRVTHLLGEKPAEKDLNSLMRIVKRLQRYQVGGRRLTAKNTLDLELATHSELLRKQCYRCNACGYRFSDKDLSIDYYFDEEEECEYESESLSYTVENRIGAADRSPLKLHRRAELDHILPSYLGGESNNNLQILCKSCNIGKSDLLLGYEGRGWFGSARAKELTTVSAQLFYMVVRRDNKCVICARGVRQVALRIVRRDPNGADLYINLAAKCVDCL
jgi:5-methylcytosine-specific restriction endonuclease McrA